MHHGIQANWSARRVPLFLCAVFVGFLALPLVASDYQTVFATRILILAFLALSFDLVWGFAGIMSFGQALFYGAAGFFTVILARDYGITSFLVLVPLGFVFGTLLASLIGIFLLLGSASSRMIFVALGTLILSYAGERLVRGLDTLGGQNGLFGYPAFSFMGNSFYEGVGFYFLCLSLLIVTVIGLHYLANSQFGLSVAALRENQDRARHFGYRIGLLRIVVFGLAGGLAGLGGVLAAFHEGFIGPSSVGVALSTQAVIYVLLGGVGTRLGAILGVTVIEGMSFSLNQSFQQLWPIILAGLLLLIVVFRPSGLVSFLVSKDERAGNIGIRMWKS